MIMTSGWGFQQRPTSPITKIQYTKNKKMDNEAVQKLQTSQVKTSNKIREIKMLSGSF